LRQHDALWPAWDDEPFYIEPLSDTLLPT
jgi:hypothetical protein